MNIRVKTKALAIAAAVIVVFMVAEGPAFAQQREFQVYAGGFFPGTWAGTHNINNEGIYGARGGVYLTSNLEVEGNFGYVNYLKFQNTADRAAQAFVVDVSAAYNFVVPALKRFEPFAALGAGAVMAESRTIMPAIVKDGDDFFALTYGGGIKANRLWGPVGLRTDFRGRTLPNFHGRGLNWLEATGGINFTWGER
jgi:hypothetical protein